MFALAKRSLREVARRVKWPILRRDGTITTADSTEQYALATDFDEISFFTLWDQTEKRKLRLASPSEWQALQSSGLTTSPYTWYFMEQGSSNDLVISFFPIPSSVKTYSYYYRSSKPCESSGGTAQVTWLADGDTAIIEEDLIVLDLKWRFKNAKGLPYQEEKLHSEKALERAASVAGDAGIINLGGHGHVIIDNIPERDFG